MKDMLLKLRRTDDFKEMTASKVSKHNHQETETLKRQNTYFFSFLF